MSEKNLHRIFYNAMKKYRIDEIKERFPNPLRTEHLSGRKFRLLESFAYIVRITPFEIVRVPAGFITDLASIYWLFWIVIGPPNGRYSRAAVIHDFLYFKQTYSRARSDRIFLEAMKVLKVPWWKRRLMWIAVRTFAGWVWKRHAETS